MKTTRSSVISWLKKATLANMCEYSKEKSIDMISKKTICIETNIIYNSQKEVERQMGIRQSNVSKSVRSNGRLSAGGYHFKLVEEQENLKGEN